MRILPTIAAIGAALLASACTGHVKVPPVAMEGPIGASPIPGSYAVQAQTGGWALDTKPKGFVCSAWSFDTDVNPAYEAAMKGAMRAALQKTTFVPETMTPAQLKEHGYDAQVIVYQGNARADFVVNSGFFTGSAASEIALTTTVAIVDDTGLTYQQSITGKGTGSLDVFTCDRVGDAVGRAAQEAIRNVVRESVLYVRDGLRDRRDKRLAPTAAGIGGAPPR